MENSNKNSELKKQNEELVKIAIQLGKIANLTKDGKNANEVLEVAKDLLSLSSRLDKVGN
jgi:type VI protein secretion system component VasF